MDKDLEQALKKRALGYQIVESAREYSVEEDGTLRLLRVKEVEKYYPPELSALKLLLEYEGEEYKSLATLSDDELERERVRLIGELSDGTR